MVTMAQYLLILLVLNYAASHPVSAIVPNPYKSDVLQTFYSNELWGFIGLAKHYLSDFDVSVVPKNVMKFWDPQHQEIEDSEANGTLREVFSRLSSNGLHVGRHGLDLSEVWRRNQCQTNSWQSCRCSSESSCSIGEDIALLQKYFFSSDLANYFLRVDFPAHFQPWDWESQCESVETTSRSSLLPIRRPPPLTERETLLVEKFRRDGFVRIDHWDGLPHIESVDEENDEDIPSRNILTPLLANPDSLLRKLVHGYLRTSHVTYSGVILTETDPNMTYANYDNGNWHHDGCGRRLKAWIYLNDLPEELGPERVFATRIWAGSHRRMWFQTTQYFEGPYRELNKLNKSEVETEIRASKTRVEYMYGRTFGGFIFDTNALHGVNLDFPQLKQRRRAYILEFVAMDMMEKAPRSYSGYHETGRIHHMLCNPPGEKFRVNWNYCAVKPSDTSGSSLPTNWLENALMYAEHHFDRPKNSVLRPESFVKKKFEIERAFSSLSLDSSAMNFFVPLEAQVRRFLNPSWNLTRIISDRFSLLRAHNQRPTANSCSLQKVYHPSTLETEWSHWVKNVWRPACLKNRRGCLEDTKLLWNQLACPKYLAKDQGKVIRLLNYIRSTQIGFSSPAGRSVSSEVEAESILDDNALSFMEFRLNCGIHSSSEFFPIEPLLGTLRHPEVGCGGRPTTHSWMIPGREFFVDVEHIVLGGRSIEQRRGGDGRGRDNPELGRNQWSFEKALHSPVTESESVGEPEARNLMDRMIKTSMAGTLVATNTKDTEAGQCSDGSGPRVIFFDVGAGWGESDSVAEFFSAYQKKGMRFDKIFAWEPAVPQKFRGFAPLPQELLLDRAQEFTCSKSSGERVAGTPYDASSLEFYTIPAASTFESSTNPLSKLVQFGVRLCDFVIFKLDIDNPALEADFLYQILHAERRDYGQDQLAGPTVLNIPNYNIRDLIDELFLEHHFAFGPVSNWFGMNNLTKYESAKREIMSKQGERDFLDPTLWGSYELLSRLRQSGIRAHGWI